MKSLTWLLRVLLVPVVAIALLVLWAVWTFPADDQHMSEWAAAFLFGGLAVSAAAPRLGITALYAAFLLQLVRPECRFGPVGWVAYGAVALIAIVLAGRTPEARRRRTLGALLPLGVLIGLFTNLPGLEASDLHRSGDFPPFGLVNGKSWQPQGYGSWADLVGTGQLELIVGLVVWSAGAVLLLLAGWSIGSSYRARRLQWAAETAAETARADLRTSRRDLADTEGRDRVVQDVHDLTAHSLSVILAQADGAAVHAPDTGSRAAFALIAGNARTALTEIRTLLEHLDQPPEGDTRSVADVPALVQQVRATGRAVDLEQHGTAEGLSATAGLAAYRIVQEALTNALRHGADDGTVRIVLDGRPEGLAISIASPLRDQDPPSTDGRGVLGMQQRARLAGGWLTAGADGDAYLVTAHLPGRTATEGHP